MLRVTFFERGEGSWFSVTKRNFFWTGVEGSNPLRNTENVTQKGRIFWLFFSLNMAAFGLLWKTVEPE